MTIARLKKGTTKSMDDIVLLHRQSSKSQKLFSAHVPVWKTCLRQIAFVVPSQHGPLGFLLEQELEEGDERLEGAAAFAFLLEVICGLRSPVLGETEVFGQFKNFVGLMTAASQNSSESVPPSAAEVPTALRNYFQALIQSAKSLRSQHLVGLGSQGYGSLVRKLSKTDSAVSLLGSGQLASEVLPWLLKEKTTQVICRNFQRGEELKASHSSLEVAAFADASCVAHSCLIVAAPISDQDLLSWLQQRPGQVRKILDLRGELEDATAFKDYQFISLKDVFENIEKNKAELEHKVIELKKIVHARAQEHCERIYYRPFGWEDLCV